ncbi:hypothetical protein [Nostoc sp. UHCC 0252]|uniref:hypothetical protein n=1 Tax=Nostoc sp. UHCC 0252 TaxID=3110241 RepID=UPI002B21957D|nr:hypothetical protein [Nostoc sp. UHCC 0252]MEA5601592.1 hypothetical protein [Nostoc sp. UHCC 0252]
MKFLMTFTIASTIITSTFVQPAIAQWRTGNTYSEMGENQAGVLSQFSLVNKTKNFKSINDEAKNNPNLGIFRGAIENYQYGLAWACSTTFPGIYDDKGNLLPPCNSGTRGTPPTSSRSVYFFDNSGFLLLIKPFNPSTVGFNGDLYAELIPNDPLFGGKRNTIGYKIFKPGQKQAVQTYRLDLSALDINQDKAINDLAYILQKDLLSKAIAVKSSPPDNKPRLSSLANILLQQRFKKGIPPVFKQP